MSGQALQASASSNFRMAAHHHHPLHHQHLGHHQGHGGSTVHQPTHDSTEEEGVDVVGLDSSDSTYSHHSK